MGTKIMKKILCTLGCLLSVTTVSAFENGHPYYSWAPNPALLTGADLSLGVGVLNGGGASIFGDLKGSYADENYELSLNIPLAAVLSDNLNDFGMGNISVAGRYLFDDWEEHFLGFGLEAAFPTSTSGAQIGRATRHFYRYAQDQWAFVPEVFGGWNHDRLSISAGLGLPLQILQDQVQPEGDALETALSYDVGAGVALSDLKDTWVTFEVGGYRTLSYGTIGNSSEVFGSLGAQYQDDEKAFGLSVGVPFTDGARNTHHLFVMADMAYRF